MTDSTGIRNRDLCLQIPARSLQYHASSLIIAIYQPHNHHEPFPQIKTWSRSYFSTLYSSCSMLFICTFLEVCET